MACVGGIGHEKKKVYLEELALAFPGCPTSVDLEKGIASCNGMFGYRSPEFSTVPSLVTMDLDPVLMFFGAQQPVSSTFPCEIQTNGTTCFPSHPGVNCTKMGLPEKTVSIVDAHCT